MYPSVPAENSNENNYLGSRSLVELRRRSRARPSILRFSPTDRPRAQQLPRTMDDDSSRIISSETIVVGSASDSTTSAASVSSFSSRADSTKEPRESAIPVSNGDLSQSLLYDIDLPTGTDFATGLRNDRVAHANQDLFTRPPEEETTESEFDPNNTGSIQENSSTESTSGEETSDSETSDKKSSRDEEPTTALPTKFVNAKGRPQVAISQKHSARRPGPPQALRYVSIPPLLVPKSIYGGWRHKLPVCDERSALKRLLNGQDAEQNENAEFNEIALDDFVIYRPGTHPYYPWQMLTVDNIVSNRGGHVYLLNGVLRRGDKVEYIEGVEIDIDAISIDGFEDRDIHSVHDKVYMQTLVCARCLYNKNPCWYRLGRPSEEYRHLHEKFVWVADFTKHVVDYLDFRYNEGDHGLTVHLRDFQQDFWSRITEWHTGDVDFKNWSRQYNKTDFRVPINRHRELIFSRAFNLESHYLQHELWSELNVRPAQTIPLRNKEPENTVVTPYVARCCQSMPWNYALRSKRMIDSVKRQRRNRAITMVFPLTTIEAMLPDTSTNIPETAAFLERAAMSGSTISINPEEALDRFAIIRMKQNRGSNTHNFSYVYIQEIVNRQGQIRLKVIYVYLPSETMCLDGQYPWGNELFLSDCCNCSAKLSPILLTDIVRLVGVNIGDSPLGSNDFFVRQKYVYAQDAICRINESDFRCPCRQRLYGTNKGKTSQIEQREPLSGLGLFAGCGNFDSGLETCGAVKFVAAIEINEAALKTYAAARSQGLDGLVLDSVNSCLLQILDGSAELPAVGAVQFISAGSPCKGFSKINSLRGNDQGMRNCSLIASTVSYIETYLPEYAILENVVPMGSGIGNSGNQVIACLVGLGYQVRKFEYNSRDAGSAQNRLRLFILAAAPNVRLPQTPKRTHSISTGLITASKVSEGLPDVDNDDLMCVSHPDHIPGVRQTPMLRELIRRVPRYRQQMGFLKSIEEGYQGTLQLEWLQTRKSIKKIKNHMAFTRLDPDGFIPTITTAPTPSCGFGGGRIIHWDQHRVLTLLEARRAQGFPDDEVIIGDLPQQWVQVGNAVNRQVAAAIGKVIAESWFSVYPAEPIIEIFVPTHQPIEQEDKKRGECFPRLTRRSESAEDKVASTRRTTMLADQIHKETQTLIAENQDPLDHSVAEYIGTGDREDPIDVDTYSTISMPMDEGDKQAGEIAESPLSLSHWDESTTPAMRDFQNEDKDAIDLLSAKKLHDEEVEFLKEIFRPYTTASAQKSTTRASNEPACAGPPIQGMSNMTFTQTQRRETATVEHGPNGEKQPVRMIEERSLEIRQRSSSPRISESPVYSSRVTETEVSVSKRKRSDDSDSEGEELKNWVGRRVRARLGS
jgi:site-specific DNA-cytosine methylase